VFEVLAGCLHRIPRSAAMSAAVLASVASKGPLRATGERTRLSHCLPVRPALAGHLTQRTHVVSGDCASAGIAHRFHVSAHRQNCPRSCAAARRFWLRADRHFPSRLVSLRTGKRGPLPATGAEGIPIAVLEGVAPHLHRILGEDRLLGMCGGVLQKAYQPNNQCPAIETRKNSTVIQP
jgi:hypothetical protein